VSYSSVLQLSMLPKASEWLPDGLEMTYGGTNREEHLTVKSKLTFQCLVRFIGNASPMHLADMLYNPD